MRVLALGVGAKEFTQNMLGADAIIDTADITPSDKQKNYDVVIALNVLVRIPYGKVEKVLEHWRDALRAGGELVIYFPSLEWAARQILYEEKPSPMLQVHLFGAQTNSKEYYCGAYTLLQVRNFLQHARIQVTHVKTGTYEVQGYEADLHSIRGVK